MSDLCFWLRPYQIVAASLAECKIDAEKNFGAQTVLRHGFSKRQKNMTESSLTSEHKGREKEKDRETWTFD